MRRRTAALLGVTMLLAACGATEVLVSKPVAVPVGLDLSGDWVLVETTGTNQPAARKLPVYVFFESGKAIRITQTGGGLFISFDRAVVEEYRYGENREVSVGPIDASRVSGWEGGGYVVETLDDDGAKLIDSYHLLENGERLRRSVVIVHRNRNVLDLQMIFDRVGAAKAASG